MYTYAKRNKKVWEVRSDISRKIVTLQEIQTFVNQSEDDIRTNIEEEEEDLDQFSTENHECLAIICQNGQRACGISVFRKGKMITQRGKTRNSLSSKICT